MSFWESLSKSKAGGCAHQKSVLDSAHYTTKLIRYHQCTLCPLSCTSFEVQKLVYMNTHIISLKGIPSRNAVGVVKDPYTYMWVCERRGSGSIDSQTIVNPFRWYALSKPTLSKGRPVICCMYYYFNSSKTWHCLFLCQRPHMTVFSCISVAVLTVSQGRIWRHSQSWPIQHAILRSKTARPHVSPNHLQS